MDDGSQEHFPSQERDGNARDLSPSDPVPKPELPAFEIYLRLNWKILLGVITLADVLTSTVGETLRRVVRQWF